jgi:hypothetical protein
MDPLPTDSVQPPPDLRTLALRLLLETVEHSLNGACGEGRTPPGRGELWPALRSKCGELSALILRAHDPGEAAAYVLGYLPAHFEYVFEQLFGRKRRPAPEGFDAVRPVAWRDADLASPRTNPNGRR